MRGVVLFHGPGGLVLAAAIAAREGYGTRPFFCRKAWHTRPVARSSSTAIWVRNVTLALTTPKVLNV